MACRAPLESTSFQGLRLLPSLGKGKKSKKVKKAKRTNSVLLWHQTFLKLVRQRFGLSKYQILWLTFGKGLVIGYALALLIHR